MDYKIVRGVPADVEQQVKQLLGEGWTLHGDLFSLEVDRQQIVAQGMIKNKLGGGVET